MLDPAKGTVHCSHAKNASQLKESGGTRIVDEEWKIGVKKSLPEGKEKLTNSLGEKNLCRVNY